MLRPLFTAVTVLSAVSMPHASPLPGGKQTGVVLDAGSSSTKVHVYSLEKVPGKIPKVEEIFYSKVKPGISGFEDNVNEITTYISQIMAAITEAVPAPSVTPVYFMATAGLRLLDENATRAIVSGVEAAMSDASLNPFVYDEEYVHILSGEEEALYAWITVNYLNHYFEDSSPIPSESYGLVELGGGSLQIAFIPDDPIYAGKMTIQLAGREYDIYGHSHLSYGATLMAERVPEYLIKENPYASVIVNPCMLRGDSANHTFGDKTIGMVGGGNASLCESILLHYLSPQDTDMCSPRPCSIGQVYQPPVRDRNFFTFGLIYYLAKDLGVLSGPGMLDLQKLQSNVRTYCKETLQEVTEKRNIDSKWASRNCQDGLYIPLIFSALGFNLNTNKIFAGKDIEDKTIAWSLGAILYEEERNRYDLFTSQVLGKKHNNEELNAER